MPRLIIALVLLAEINFRCVPNNGACEDDDEQSCEEPMEGESETDGETETGDELEPSPDLGG